MPSAADLWKSAVDPRSGRTYYYHTVTRETQWRKPMELASDEEKRAMEEKERRQKDFFAAMEANILNSLQQGIIPGTPNVDNVPRKKSSVRTPDRPGLVRTISAMDETVLSDLIRRQPSYRALTKEKSLEIRNSLHRKPSQALNPLAESVSELNYDDDGNDIDLFEGLPDESTSHLVDDSEGSMDDMGESLRSNRSYGTYSSKMDESSIAGFGLTWEETQALKQLAQITKEMVETENKDVKDVERKLSRTIISNNTKNKSGPATPIPELSPVSPAKPTLDNKGPRELPIELELDDESESSDDDSPKKPRGGLETPALDQARSLPRDLDFDDSDSDSDSDIDDSDVEDSATPVKTKSVRIAENAIKPPKKKEENDDRPNIKRRNTCGTLYVGSTMSAPDVDATIRCISGVYRAHILSSEQEFAGASVAERFLIFNDFETEQGGDEYEGGPMLDHEVPSLNTVSAFFRDIFYKAQMETDTVIMSLIYVERLIKKTKGQLRPRASNWRSLLFSCMILSSKVWDDLSMWNVDFSQSCPPGVSFPLKRINELELAILHALGFQVKVPASEYAKYYFLLRSMLIKSGLGGDKITSLDPLDVLGARKLQQVSSQFESVSQTKSGVANALNNRSKSLDVTALKKRAAKNAVTPGKVGLEHVVHM